MAIIDGATIVGPPAVISASPPPTPGVVAALRSEPHRADLQDGGPGEIRGDLPAGLVTFDGVPGHARVYAMERAYPRVIRATRSAADGTYRLTDLKLGVEYLVLARDERNIDNAVVMDRVPAGVPDED